MRFPHIFIPPIFLRPSIENRFANLLISASVQQISFRLGHVHVLPAHFRAVADALRDGTLSVTFNPTALAADGSLAEYDSGSDTFTFLGDTVLDTAHGRAVAIHEASHAVADFRVGDTAIRHEEGAAHICEAWYLLNIGADPSATLPAEVVTAATGMRERAAQGRPVRGTATDINSVRRAMARLGYENAFYDNDGF